MIVVLFSSLQVTNCNTHTETASKINTKDSLVKSKEVLI